MASPNFRMVDPQINRQKSSHDLFACVIRIDGQDKVDMQKASSPLEVQLGMMYVFSVCLKAEEKQTFSKWTNLPTTYWGDEHKRAYAIAHMNFLLRTKELGIKLPPKLPDLQFLDPDHVLPHIDKQFTPEIIKLFAQIYEDL